MLRQQIKSYITPHLPISDTVKEGLFFEVPTQESFGELSTNIAFQLARELKKAPKSIAEDLCQSLNATCSDIATFEAVNGFINLKLSQDVLWTKFSTLFNAPLFEPIQTDPVLVEYVSANPTGPLHIGHGRWAVLGSALCHLLKVVGYPTLSEFYINDAGNQITLFYESVNAVKANKPIPENGYHGDYILDLAKSDEDPLQINLHHQKNTLEKVGAEFDAWFSEKSLHNSGEIQKVLTILKEKGHTFEQEGALWFRSTEWGDTKDRVLIKADGNLTYFAVDIAYHLHKVNKQVSRLINIWGADHHGYVPRVKAGLAALAGNDYLSDDKLKVIIGQLVSLKRGGEPVRMSKRTGEMITLEEVIDEIGVDATRYFLLEKSSDTHVEFDLELAVKKSAENPVYYIQYAHARICSILDKADIQSLDQLTQPQNPVLEPIDLKVITKVCRLQDVLWDAAAQLAPYKVAQYGSELARIFHHYYEEAPILKAEEAQKQTRLYILKQVKETLLTVFSILGISAPNAM